jgi:galactose mutarotase-like enzyme
MNEITLQDEAAGLEATFVPSAGMICRSLTHGGVELLAQRRGLEEYVARGKTMGIPLLHPWANRLGGLEYEVEGERVRLDPDSPVVRLEEHGLPIHGLLAASPYWSLTSSDARSLTAELDFGAHEELLAAFPFPHRLRYEASLEDRALTVRLTLAPTSGIAVPVAFGFHPYLNLPAAREDTEVRLPVRRRMLLDERMLPTGRTEDVEPYDGPVRAWDDAFDRLERPARFTIRGGGRTVELEFVDGYSFTQVFSPPDAPFVCFEPMTAPADALRHPESLELVAPGAHRSATFRIVVT